MRLFDYRLLARLFVCGVLFLGVILEGKPKLPDWVADSMDFGDAYEQIDGDADALVLHDWVSKRLYGKNRFDVHGRYMVHMKSRSEREWAIANLSLDSKADKLVRFKAWLIFPSGKVEVFGKRDGVTLANNVEALYDEMTVFILNRSSSITRDDCIFAYEYELTRDKRYFLQDSWLFQRSIPSLYVSYGIEVPEGWSVSSTPINSDKIVLVDSSEEYRWEMKNVPAIDVEEEYGPPWFSVCAWMGINIEPPASIAAKNSDFVFKNWNDVAVFGYLAQEGQKEPSDAIRSKADELVKGAENQWEKIQAICDYVQTVNYMQVNIDLSKGGGYEPHSAAEVFERHYGDCKDMTVLTLSMLETQGIDAYAVSASVGDGRYVHDEWASPFQFDHCIVGITVGDDVDLPSVVEDPSNGKVLIFDPTNSYTPVGYLSRGLQGTKILVDSPRSEGLVQLPVGGGDRVLETREIDVAIGYDGMLRGTVSFNSRGPWASYLRRQVEVLNSEDLKELFRSWIAHGAREAKVSSVTYEDDKTENRMSFEIAFSSSHYGKVIARNSMMFRPVFLGRINWVPPVEDERSMDYVTWPITIEETIRYRLPEEAVSDEMPEAFQIDSSFAEYSLRCEGGEGEIEVKRLWKTEYEVVPHDRYGEIVEFYDRVNRNDRLPVVVKKVASVMD